MPPDLQTGNVPSFSWRGARVLSRLTSLLKIAGWEADLQSSLGTGVARTAPSDTSYPWTLPSTVWVPVGGRGTRCPIQGELLPHRPSLPRALEGSGQLPSPLVP